MQNQLVITSDYTSVSNKQSIKCQLENTCIGLTLVHGNFSSLDGTLHCLFEGLYVLFVAGHHNSHAEGLAYKRCLKLAVADHQVCGIQKQSGCS